MQKLLSNPHDFVTLEHWCANHGAGLLKSPKLLSYHAKPFQRELILSGAMAKIGTRIYLHKELFWPEFQRIQLDADTAATN